MQSQTQYLKILLYVCKLRFFKYPSHYFPCYFLVKLFLKLNFDFRTRKLDFLLVPIPNYYFDFLLEDHLIKSEHSIFLNPKIFSYYIYKEEVNFLNVSISSRTKKCKQASETEKVIKNVLSKGAIQKSQSSTKLNGESNKMSALYQVFPLKDVPINKIFIKENAFYNLIEKYKLNDSGDLKNVFVNLQMLQSAQTVPQIVTKANIFLITSPYELSNALVDSVLVEYFRKPQFLYRNHTYLVNLNEATLGSFLFSEHFQIFSQVKRIFFKCVHLESESNPFEMCGVVMKNLTNLHQTTSIKYFVPKQLLDPHFFIKNYPLGLEKYFLDLKSSLEAFMKSSNDSQKFMKTEKLYPMFQLIGDRGSGKRRIVKAVAESLGIHLFSAECSDIMTSIASQTETKLLQALNKAVVCQPVIICFRDFELFGLNNEGHEDVRLVDFFREEIDKLFSKQEFENPIFTIALINARNPSKSVKLNHLFLESIEISPPDKTERFKNLLWLHQRERFDQKCWKIKHEKMENYISIRMNDGCENDVKILQKMADLTQGFIFGDLAFLYEKGVGYSTGKDEFVLSESLFDEKLAEMKKLFGESIGTPDIPKVLWEDIGGLAKLKTEVQNSIGLPLKFSHLMGKHMKRSGILLYGPPGNFIEFFNHSTFSTDHLFLGTGKTLIAKAVATECNLSFLSVQGPELLNMYVGQSEQNVRDVFSRARGAAPCVVFLDELGIKTSIKKV